MQLGFHQVSLRAIGTALPAEETLSSEIEQRLAPTYRRLGLVEGRLELMTGIRARRHFSPGVLPSDIAIAAAEDLFARAPELRPSIDCVIHASVCRNFLEPATAAVVHHRLGLSPSCLVFDLSDACLSWINAWAVAAGLIESGQIRAALVVCGEDARAVVETTVDRLNADASLTRQSLKPSLATLTLASGEAAAVLTRAEWGGARLLGGAFRAATEFHGLCQGGAAAENSSGAITMETDSETMLHEGVRLAVQTWKETREALKWEPSSPAVCITHQVGSAHRRLMLQKLEIDPKRLFDF